MSVIMDENAKDKTKMNLYISHLKKDYGVKILPPSINKSELTFNPVDGAIIYSLNVKDTKGDILNAIVTEREKNGPFTDILNFLQRTCEFMDKSTFKSLASVGAFDEFGIPRSSVIASVDDVFSGLQKFKSALARRIKTKKTPPELSEYINDSLFPELKEYPDDIKLKVEKAVLGLYLTSNPLQRHICSMASFSNFALKDLAYDVDDETKEITFSGNVQDKKPIQIIALLEDLNVFTTKKDKKVMAMAKVSDLTGEAKVLIFNRSYMQYKDILKDDSVYKIKGTVSIRQGEEPVIFVNSLSPIEDSVYKRLIYKCDDEKSAKEFADYILSSRMQGGSPVYIMHGNLKVLLRKKYWLDLELFKDYCDNEIWKNCTVKEW